VKRPAPGASGCPPGRWQTTGRASKQRLRAASPLPSDRRHAPRRDRPRGPRARIAPRPGGDVGRRGSPAGRVERAPFGARESTGRGFVTPGRDHPTTRAPPVDLSPSRAGAAGADHGPRAAVHPPLLRVRCDRRRARPWTAHAAGRRRHLRRLPDDAVAGLLPRDRGPARAGAGADDVLRVGPMGRDAPGGIRANPRRAVLRDRPPRPPAPASGPRCPRRDARRDRGGPGRAAQARGDGRADLPSAVRGLAPRARGGRGPFRRDRAHVGRGARRSRSARRTGLDRARRDCRGPAGKRRRPPRERPGSVDPEGPAGRPRGPAVARISPRARERGAGSVHPSAGSDRRVRDRSRIAGPRRHPDRDTLPGRPCTRSEPSPRATP